MDIVNPDLSHTNFLDVATSDIKSAKALLQIKEFHNAVYHFQQSVEKSCKFLGLTIKAFTFDELRQIGHTPQKVFDKVFYSDIFKAVSSNIDYDDFKSSFSRFDLDKKCDGTYYHVENIFKENEEKRNELHSQRVIDFYKDNPFNDLFPKDFITIIKKYKGNPEVENVCKIYLEKIENLSKALLCQMLMSFVVCGVEANSRYPDETGLAPTEIYSEKSFIVQYLDYFIEKQIFCIKIFGDYFKPVE